ncbi:MAG TPA: bifunctional transaldolase/phosoglucose isomerase, partial [Elusimicrobiota bacterium]|nr:bifunctional transaldolase/phosoglucose isomerase [Elusimicrobiota bacterium]
WRALASAGAQTQRLLWASTGVKNPRYRDVMYVEELIGPDTVDTMPPATLAAFRQHGAARRTIDDGVEAAYDVMDALAEAGISLEAVTERVLADGVRLFAEPFDRLLATIEEKTRRPEPPRFEHQSCHPSKDLAPEIPRAAEEWQAKGGSRRLWSRDASLWTGADEAGWLGWLGVVDEQLERRGELAAFRDEIRDASFAQALLLGMGGSSLAAEALSSTFGSLQGFPRLLVVDSTDPEEIARAEARIRPAETLVLVASKSGSTLETNLLKEYFFSRFERRLGRGEAGKRFIAVTDPASKLELLARAAGFRRVFHGVPSIGGRYGALSDFGMVPAAILGLDCAKLLDRAHEMVVACSSFIPAEHNPGVMLGVILGTMAVRGRNKVTLLSSPSLDGLGPWIEQLLAESTGKTGRGVVPVEGEPLGSPQDYGDDRVFVYTRLDSDPPGPRDAALARLEEAGHPVVRIDVGDVYDIGQEFFRWELATAVLGSLLGVNPFDQPDVEASKAAARALTREFERSGALPAEAPFFESDAARVYAPAETARRLSAKARERTLPELLRAHLDSLRPGDYWAELVYLAREERSGRILEDMRAAVRSAKRTATCLGYGPRFLHSTGQLHKGGPDAGVFLQITCDDRLDLAVPGHPYTFGTVKAAQARGDLEALSRRGRRVLRVHLRSPEGLERLRDALLQALK